MHFEPLSVDDESTLLFPLQKYEKSKRKWKKIILGSISLSLLIFAIVLLSAFVLKIASPQKSPYSISEAIDKCVFHKPSRSDIPVYRNERSKQSRSILIRNATVWNGLGEILPRHDLLISDGIIADIKADIEVRTEYHLIEANGRIITPGIVDMHSHMGMATWPSWTGTNDVNEATNPVFSQLRAMDAFNPQDPSIYLITSGGVTTSLVLPGSANIMGGEAFVVKNKPRQHSVADMFIYSQKDAKNSSVAWRWMKMALGENPKRNYGPSKTPETRMGTAWLFREKLFKASQLKKKQDEWCRSFEDGNYPSSAFPEEIELESLVALLRGKVLLNVHVYEVHDIETLFRMSKEFGFSISAIHHATSAHLVADMLVKERTAAGSLNADLTAAIFSDKGYYKAEAYHASTLAPSILKAHGVPFAFKSDHPVTNSQFLTWNAAKAVHYGLSPLDALSAITSVPARALGVSDRVGSVRKGMHADIVIWDEGNPVIDIGARPATVIIDGDIVFTKSNQPLQRDCPETPSSFSLDRMNEFCEALRSRHLKKKEFYILLKNVTIHADPETLIVSGELLLRLNPLSEEPNYFISSSSETVCFGPVDSCLKDAQIDAENILSVDLSGGVVIPGIIAPVSSLGLVEISQESGESSGASQESLYDPVALDGGVGVLNGLEFGIGDGRIAEGGFSKLLEISSRAGVSRAISVPLDHSSGIIRGRSVLLSTAAESADNGGVLLDNVGIHVSIGRKNKDKDLLASVHGQLRYLSDVLKRALEEYLFKNGTTPFLRRNIVDFERTGRRPISFEPNWFIEVIKGVIPLVVHIDNAEQISALLRIKKDVESRLTLSRINLVIVGGSEAWMVAQELAAANVSVVLKPLHCTPEDFDSKRCRSLSSLYHPILVQNTPKLAETGLSILLKEGVKVALAVDEDNMIPTLIWEAGWARWMSNRHVDGSPIPNRKPLSIHEAIGLVTWNVDGIFKISSRLKVPGAIGVIRKGMISDMIVYVGGHPLQTVQSQVALTVSATNNQKSIIRCMPKQL